MSRLAIGTAQFGLPYGIANNGEKVSRIYAKEILELAKFNKIDVLDTAISYGESEACLGELGINTFKVITKLPKLPSSDICLENWIYEQIKNSFKRLRVKKIYGVLLHHPDELLNFSGEKLYNLMMELKISNKVQKIGISVYSPDQLEAITKNFDFDIIQIPLNIIDHRFLISGCIEHLKKRGVEIHTRSSFLQGLLLMPQNKIPDKFSPWKNLFSRWFEWLENNKVTALQACISFSLLHKQIDRVIVGVGSSKQLEEILSIEKNGLIYDFPLLGSDDINLINPSNWNQL